MNRLFESNVKGDVPDTVDAEIIFRSASYILYEQFNSMISFEHI